MSVFRHSAAALGNSGLRNWFGDGSDGHIRLTVAAGAEQSFDGVLWSPMPGWSKTDGLITVPSVQDGDMVVVNARNLTVEAGVTLTTTHRCRGLLIYATGNVLINGVVSMTARGCKANPGDSIVTANTPVAPSDGLPVSINGLRIAKFAPGYTASGASDLSGCGLAARNAEANQPAVDGNGFVWVSERVGGPGGLGVGSGHGKPGGTKAHSPGGAGSGAAIANYWSAKGGDATCFSGGAASGGNDANILNPGPAASNYGGPGGAAEGNASAGGGAGNPGGAKAGTGTKGNDGTGGLLLIIARGSVSGTGRIESRGTRGGSAPDTGQGCAGGSSGSGTALLLHGGALSGDLVIDVSGVAGGDGGYANGGAGGHGSATAQQINP